MGQIIKLHDVTIPLVTLYQCFFLCSCQKTKCQMHKACFELEEDTNVDAPSTSELCGFMCSLHIQLGVVIVFGCILMNLKFSYYSWRQGNFNLIVSTCSMINHLYVGNKHHYANMGSLCFNKIWERLTIVKLNLQKLGKLVKMLCVLNWDDTWWTMTLHENNIIMYIENILVVLNAEVKCMF